MQPLSAGSPPPGCKFPPLLSVTSRERSYQAKVTGRPDAKVLGNLPNDVRTERRDEFRRGDGEHDQLHARDERARGLSAHPAPGAGLPPPASQRHRTLEADDLAGT